MKSTQTTVVTRRADWMMAIGIFAVLMVMVVAIWVDETDFAKTTFGILLIALTHIIYCACLVVFVRAYRSNPNSNLSRSALIIEILIVVLLEAIDPRKIYLYDTLVVIWSAQLPYFYSVWRSVAAGCFMLLIVAGVRLWWGIEYFFINELILHFVFISFVVFSSRNALAAEEAKEEISRKNAELLAMQNLLAESAQENERLRIARDLHDTMGHYLTALSIQLEVAQHQTDENAKSTLQQAQQLAKSLLTEVRTTVSNMRTPPNMNIRNLFSTLISSVPRLHIDFSIENDLEINDARVAEALIRSGQEIITNTLKHAEAEHLTLRIASDGQNIVMDAYDDGQLSELFQMGNGLRGMQERAEMVGGELHVSRTLQGGMQIRLTLPREIRRDSRPGSR